MASYTTRGNYRATVGFRNIHYYVSRHLGNFIKCMYGFERKENDRFGNYIYIVRGVCVSRTSVYKYMSYD